MPLIKATSDQMRRVVDPDALGFTDTTELVPLPLPWIGQERAEQAARFGLRMDQPDYNLFVLGEVGSGRTTMLQELMAAHAAHRPVPPDLCYLYNFDAPKHPRALRLPAGEGRVLRQSLVQFVKLLHTEIPKRLAAADFKAESESIQKKAKAREDSEFAQLSAYADAHRFALIREQGNLVFTMRDEAGKPLSESQAFALPPGKRAELDQDEQSLRAEIAGFMDRQRTMERAMDEELAALQRRLVAPMLERELAQVRNVLRKQIKDAVKLTGYLDQVLADVLDNLDLFLACDDDEDEDARQQELEQLASRLRVNLAVDNAGREGAPVIIEDNPMPRALFGGIEYESDSHVLATDFSRIRAGSLLQAHGGYLMLRLRDLLADEPVWERLRRYLRSGRLQIEEPGTSTAPIAAVSLEPEPVAVDVKIVLIASVDEYYAIQESDPEFARRFRCKVDFADSFVATPGSHKATAIFIAHTCARLGLPHFTAPAAAAVIEQTHRAAEDQTRQSAIFSQVEALVIESATLARERAAPRVEAGDVLQALRAHVHRHDYPEQRLQETIIDGERLLVADGVAPSQVNALTVMDLGDYRFGFPVRVTARTHAGDDGLLNIEREVELSGPIHDKGVLILNSYLSALFAHVAPLALSAAIVFEQENNGVEGDSASCAEMYALLSSLSGLPLRQDIAVTGAVNQHGEMMPVGGINEKIEGWFRTCEQLGLTGTQGVLMPRRNRRHLMLDARLVDAVAAGRFHLYFADQAGDGMQLLTGVDFGEAGATGYPQGSVLGRAQKTLRRYRLACQATLPGRRRGMDGNTGGRYHLRPRNT